MAENEIWFWSIVNASLPSAKTYSARDHILSFNENLSALSDNDLIKFHELFEAMMIQSYIPSLWNAGYIMANGMGDDDFANFRSALIAHGSEVFDSTLNDPECLAKYPLADKLLHNEFFYNPVYDELVERHGEDYALEKLEFQPLPDLNEETLSEDPLVLRQMFPALFDKYWKPE